MVLASNKPIVWCSSRQATVTVSSTKEEYSAAYTGAKTLTWLATLSKELHIPDVNRPKALCIYSKPATKDHESNIITYKKQYLLLLTDNRGAFDISRTNGPS